MRRLNKEYSVEVVMLGSQEECKRFNVEISILDSSAKQVFPINQDEWGDFSLTVKEPALAKIWKHDSENKEYVFKVKVHICRC